VKQSADTRYFSTHTHAYVFVAKLTLNLTPKKNKKTLTKI